MNSNDANLENKSSDVELYFCYSATLRIHGKNLNFELINEMLKIQPTYMHRQGEYRMLRGKKVDNNKKSQ